ncbi:MAG TPA: acyl-CoA dehydrogenase [Phaeodactylibacter sp.]|nr:acyl-CoA dehydrogenase [Phaeodactylibacter sp.]
MAKQYVDINTLKFLLYNVHDLEKVLSQKRYADHDKDSIDIFLDSIKDFSDKELYPCIKEMDEQAAYYKDGKIIAHPQVKTIMEKGGELGMIATIFDFEDGGLQIPSVVNTAAAYIMEAANNHLPGYIGLTQGAAELITHFGNDELKATYVANMLEGKWAGTMCLTEPQAGSSLSDVTTSATPTDDGFYKINGQKIFISGGDHEYSDNFVHLVLARIEGAPAGTKGISLFVVPKHRPNADGTLTPNDVTTAGDFQKMGQRGYCTTHLIFGEKNDCRGWLVGDAHRGLKYMFLMMNGARIAVGRGAAAIAMAAYHASLEYAKERPQGRRLNRTGKKNVTEEQCLIIEHADVRRMLLLQKSVAEGALSLILKAAAYQDLSRTMDDDNQKDKYQLLLELLMPMVKTYPSEMGAVSVSNGVQVLGGYGFTTDFILQQYLRDIRIFSLYEGTTGIQSLDLLARKVPMNGGKAVQLLAGEMMQSIQEASKYEALRPYCHQLGEKLQLVQKVLNHLGQYAKTGDYERYTADANLFMELLSNVTIAWVWLEMATYSEVALASGDTQYTKDFYESKIHTMKFFFKYELAKTTYLANVLMNEEVLTIEDGKNVF